MLGSARVHASDGTAGANDNSAILAADVAGYMAVSFIIASAARPLTP